VPATDTVVQVLAALALNRAQGITAPVAGEHTARYIAGDCRQVASFIEVLAEERRARVTVGRVWSPEGLVLGWIEVDTRHVNVVDETRAEEACVDHSECGRERWSSIHIDWSTYVSTLKRPQAVRLQEISMSLESSAEAILGPVLPTRPRASPMRMAWCSMI
jgi:hypothetical protein